jgi:hypothetical protein
MTLSQLKNLHRVFDLIAFLVLAAVACLLIPKILQFALAYMLFAACGIPLVKRLSPGADWLEKAVVGFTIGLVFSALVIYALGMVFGVTSGIFLVLAVLASLAILAIFSPKQTGQIRRSRS